MKKFRLGAFILCLFVSSAGLKAQNKLSFFADSTSKSLINAAVSVIDFNEFVYATGDAFNPGNLYASTPVITKFDKSGSQIWSYSLNKEMDKDYNDGESAYSGGKYTELAADSNYVFAALFAASTTRTYELHAIDANTGGLAWKKDVPAIRLLRVVNSQLIAYTYYNAQGQYIYELTNKKTGRIVLSKWLTSADANYHFAEDNTAWIFRGDSLFKYASPMLDNLLWSKKVYTNNGAISEVRQENDGYLYFFGNTASVFCGRLKSVDGSDDWFRQSPYNTNVLYGEIISGFKVKPDYVYLSATHTTVGSITTAYHILKVNRQTGALIWEKAYDNNGNTNPLQYSGSYFGTLSFDVDDAGNVYATGYKGDNGLKSGQWSIYKLNDAGAFIYYATLTDDIPVTTGSLGLMVKIYKNRVYYVGNLNTGSGVHAYITATDISSNTFASLLKKPITCTYQQSSSVKKIQTFSTSKYVVYKQVGNRGVIELRNSIDGDLIWSKKIGSNTYYEADKLMVTADNNIVVSALIHKAAPMAFDYKKLPDSLNFVKLDSLGNMIYNKLLYIGSQVGFKSVQLHAIADSSGVFLFSAVEYWNRPANVINKINIPKGNTAPVDSYGSTRLEFLPTGGTQNLLVSTDKDSIALMTTAPGIPTYTYTARYVGSKGFVDKVFVGTDQYCTVHNLIRCDSNTLIMLAKTDPGDRRYQVKLYNRYTNTVPWSYKEQDSLHTIEMGVMATGRLYTTGRKGNLLVVRKWNVSNGTILWQKEIATVTDNYYVPIDQQFNEQRGQYVIAGYIADTSSVMRNQRAFYMTLDSNSNVIQNWEATADYQQQNQLNTIAISQYGQTLLGGSLYKAPYGRSGILIEADKVIIPPSLVNITVCEKTLLTLTSSLTGTNYQWQQNTGNGFMDMPGNTVKLEIDTISLSWNNYQYRCMVDGFSSDVFKIIVTPLVKPSVIISIDNSNICQFSNATFTATAQNVHSYQWMVDNVAMGEDSPAFKTTELNDLAHVWVSVKNAGTCADTSRVNSNVIEMHVKKPAVPLIHITGNNILFKDTYSVLTADVQGISDPVFLQWEDSTVSHTWQRISGAFALQQSYQADNTGTAIRCILTTAAECVTTDSAASNSIVFTVNHVTAVDPGPAVQYGINMYPNPVTSVLNIDPLKLSDHWETMEIMSLDGTRRMLTQSLTNKTKVIVAVDSWAKGVYVVVLRNKKGKAVNMKFMKM